MDRPRAEPDIDWLGSAMGGVYRGVAAWELLANPRAQHDSSTHSRCMPRAGPSTCGLVAPKRQPPRSKDRGGCKNQEQVRGAYRSEADLKLRTKEPLAAIGLSGVVPPTGVSTAASTQTVGQRWI